MTQEFREMVDRRKANTLTMNRTRELLDATIAREAVLEERQRRAGIYKKIVNEIGFLAVDRGMFWDTIEARIQKLFGELNGQ